MSESVSETPNGKRKAWTAEEKVSILRRHSAGASDREGIGRRFVRQARFAADGFLLLTERHDGEPGRAV